MDARHRVSLRDDDGRRRLREAEAEVRRLEVLLDEVLEKKAAKQKELDDLIRHLDTLEARYEAEGGHLLDNHQSIREERLKFEEQSKQAEGRLREMAAGPAPLLLVSDLLRSVAEQDGREAAAERARSLEGLLHDRDARLLSEARSYPAPDELLTHLEKFLAGDRSKRSAEAETESYLHLSGEGREVLGRLSNQSATETLREECTRLVSEAEGLQARLVDFDRRLAGVPEAEKLAPVIEEIKAARVAIHEEKIHLAAIDMEVARVTRERDQKKARWLGHAEESLGEQLELEDVQRILSHSQRVRRTLAKFRGVVVERNVSRVEQLIMDSFKQLLRKRSLISALRIDPERFTLELRGSDGQVLSPDRLSAGERQLLAVSMLWGLARASGRPLPTVIDTPLGRLDGAHRANLVERYFPYASHQVLLLSTDEEIDQEHFEKLRPWVGHAYKLDFDDARGETTIKSGYFW